MLLRGTLLLSLLAGMTIPPLASAASDIIPGQYIVTYKSSVVAPNAATDQREKRDGFKSRLRYSKAIRGFSARLSTKQVKRLQDDTQVLSVVPDRVVQAAAAVLPGETIPTGVSRIGAVGRGASTVGVAVIDTGVDLSHPDLNAISGTNCVTPGAKAQDDNGHGTHVAGTIAARNNGSGVVGVAPGTPIYAVKVLDASASGSSSGIVCGIDWVTANATTLRIRVANMSLGGTGSTAKPCSEETSPIHLAICRGTAAGVTFVVAAGNSGSNFDRSTSPTIPASFPDVLTVTAMSDSDGRTGAVGGVPSCFPSQADDKYASFSNYASTAAGESHTVAGPGVCIRSAAMGGGSNVMSGTSMASPHIAGRIALCLEEEGLSGPCAGLTPAAIIAKVVADAREYNTSNTGLGYYGDPLHSPILGRYYGFLLQAISKIAAPVNYAVTSGKIKSGSLSSLTKADSSYLIITSGSLAAGWASDFLAPSTAPLTAKISMKTSVACSYTLRAWNWYRSSWTNIASGNLLAGTSDTTIKASLPTSSEYLSSGKVRIGTSCVSLSQEFEFSTNLASLSYPV